MSSWFSRLALLIALTLPVAASAQSRIDQLTAGSAVSSTDSVPNCQGCGAATPAVQTTMAQILTWIESAFQKASSSVFGVVKVDGSTITASGGVISATGSGTGTVTSVGLAPGLAKTPGTRNTGADAITVSGTVNPQLFPVNKSSSYTVNADNGGTSDTGALLISTGASVTFTAPNPASGTKGDGYPFGSDGTHGFTLTTVGGTATFYGSVHCTGGTSATIAANIDVSILDDGTNYKCTEATSTSGGGFTGTWTTYTPTLTCGSGTLTSASATGRSVTNGHVTSIYVKVTVTTVGSCVNLIFSAPNTVTQADTILSGRNDGTGITWGADSGAANSTTFQLFAFNNSTSVASGDIFFMSGTYENN